MGLPQQLAGFAVLPVTYSSKITHMLYVKAHAGSKNAVSKALPSDRTLFLVNVPPDATERELSLLLKPAGLVERVILNQTAALDEAVNSDSDEEEGNDGVDDTVPETSTSARPRKRSKGKKPEVPSVKPLPSRSLRMLRETGGTAYVVFLDSSSLSRLLEAPTKVLGLPRPWTRSEEPSGLAHYKALHLALRPPLDAVRAHANSALERYDYEQEAKKQKSQYKKGEAIVDEEGFTLVTRGGAYGKTLGGGVGVARKQFSESAEASKKKEKKRSSKEGLYDFRSHEKKRQKLLELQSKFEEDKAKVAQLRESRRFRPY